MIDYSLLSDPSLTATLLDAFNANLASAPRPSYLGPIQLNSFDFGTDEPDVEVVGLRDVYNDFLDAEEDEDDHEDEQHQAEHGGGGGDSWHDEQSSREGGGGWADEEGASSSRHTSTHTRDIASPPPSFTMGPLPPFHGRPGFDFGSPFHNGSPYTSRVGLGSTRHSPVPTPYVSRNPSFASLPPLQGGPSWTPSSGSHHHHLGDDRAGGESSRRPSQQQRLQPNRSSFSKPPDDGSSSGPPSLQLHLHVHHDSNIRISLSTTLLINHPSPSFMSLPLTLTITRLELDFHLVVAFQSSASTTPPAQQPQPPPTAANSPSSSFTNPPRLAPRRSSSKGNRVHLSILDELDPYGPPVPLNPDSPSPVGAGLSADGKPLPIGQRIIPKMEIESGIGQEGEHVLRNVQKVERFVLDLLRKTIVDELVFPNFQTLVV